jgi:hypothetical protein
MGRYRKAPQGAFLLAINIVMISAINFSKLFLVRRASPVGNNSGYYPAPNIKPVVPVICRPVKL